VSDPSALRRAARSHAPAIARLHADLISEGFLVTLGEPFLERLYRRVVNDHRSFAFVSVDDATAPTGFIAVAEDTRRLYREFILRDGLFAAARAAPAIVRRPRHVVETLRHGTSGAGERIGAEILAVAVVPSARGEGIGAALVTAATDELRRRGISQAHVVTVASNEAARRMYRKCGFEPRSTIEVHRGVAQDLLVWS
jgi:ribosomal protein S18 acetylase RimI-like enzyme